MGPINIDVTLPKLTITGVTGLNDVGERAAYEVVATKLGVHRGRTSPVIFPCFGAE